jgi:DNA-binding NarL/FixJ family response regulator
MSRVKILLADDDVVVCEGLQSLLEAEFDIVGTVLNGEDLLVAARSLNPDVIVTDISMPILNGIEAVRQLRREGNETKVVFVTMHNDAQIAGEAFLAGGDAYILKQTVVVELTDAIRSLLDGQRYLTPIVAEQDEHLLSLVVRVA